MKCKLLFLSIFSILSLAACGESLVDDIYKHAHDKNKNSITSFIILSNIRLSEGFIEKIEDDYRKEKSKNIKYYYEYLLAKRTQEEKYINAFISNSKNHLDDLRQNNSNWISISSPVYKQLAYYSKTNDDALNILFELIKVSDGANLSVISDDLNEIRKISPDRFLNAVRKSGVRESEINNLMENE